MLGPAPRPHAILFDIGGTLLREEGYDLRPGVAALEPRGDAEALRDELQASIDRVHRSKRAEFTLLGWLEEHRADFGRPGSSRELEQVVWDATVRLVPMPGVAEALEAIAPLGLPLACVSNAVFSAEALRSELARYQLEHGFEFVLSSADFGVRKPDPAIFAQALSRLGTEAGSSWFVGDDWQADIEGAQAAGLFAVWLADGTARVSSVPQARGWNELSDSIREALR